jgi:hypothetical protein
VALTPVLIYLLATNVFHVGGSKPKPAARPSAPPPAHAFPVVSAPEVARVRPRARIEVEAEIVEKQKEIARRMPSRNPFIASHGGPSSGNLVPSASRSSASLKVSGVVLSPGSNARMAIINGKMYEEGDSLGDWIILHVHPNEVVFGSGQQRRSVPVK